MAEITPEEVMPLEMLGKPNIWVRALTPEFLKKEWLEKSLKRMVNREITWRHQHPLSHGKKDKAPLILGYVNEVRINDNDELEIKYELLDYVKSIAHLHDDLLVEFVNEADPQKRMGISAHYYKYLNENKTKTKFVHFQEFAVTPFPKCDTCRIIDLEFENKMEVDIMSTTNAEAQDSFTKEDLLKSAVVASNEKLEKVQAQVKEFATKIEKLEKDNKDLKTKNETLINEYTKIPYLKKIFGDDEAKIKKFLHLDIELIKEIPVPKTEMEDPKKEVQKKIKSEIEAVVEPVGQVAIDILESEKVELEPEILEEIETYAKLNPNMEMFELGGKK